MLSLNFIVFSTENFAVWIIPAVCGDSENCNTQLLNCLTFKKISYSNSLCLIWKARVPHVVNTVIRNTAVEKSHYILDSQQTMHGHQNTRACFGQNKKTSNLSL